MMNVLTTCTLHRSHTMPDDYPVDAQTVLSPSEVTITSKERFTAFVARISLYAHRTVALCCVFRWMTELTKDAIRVS